MNAAATSESMVLFPRPLKVIRHVSLAYLAMIVAIALLLDALAIFDVLAPHVQKSLLGVSAVFLGAIYGGYLLLALLLRPRLRIGPDGFTAPVGLFANYSRAWSDIEGEFVALRIAWQRLVVYRLTADCKKSIKFKPTKAYQGYDGAISVVYFDWSEEELSKMLNACKHTAQQLDCAG